MRYLILLLAFVIFGAALRLWQLDRLPPGFHFDEAFEGLEAWRILTEPSYRPIFLTGNFGVPPFNAYANALTFGVWQALSLPVGPTAMRTTAAFFGVLGLVALWGLAHELRSATGRWRSPLSPLFPVWAVAILATMRWHIHFSRMGIEPIIVPLIWTAATGLFLHGWRTKRYSAFAGSGLVLASGMYAYQGAWVIPFLLAATAAIWFLWDSPWLHENDGHWRRLRHQLLGMGLAALVATVLVAPLGWFFAQNMELVFLRPAQLSIVGETASPADSNLADSIWATATMYGPFGSPGDRDPRRNLPGAPALSLWYAIPFYLGIALTLLRMAQPVSLLLLVGLVGLLSPGVVSEYAPHFHRILGATAPTALLCAVGLDWLWQWRTVRVPRVGLQGGQWLVVLLLIGGTIRETQNYFVRWAALPDLFHAFDVGLWEIGQQIAVQPSATPVYLTPRHTDHATLAFAWSTRPAGHGAPVTFDGRQIFPLTVDDNERDEYYFVIEHEDFRTRLLWPGLFAQAPIDREFVDGTGEVYARIYRRPAHTPVLR
ncbi:MAG: hypothetical protein KDE53_00530, partial [Caldilineaceae bacterium]|nr:hypothetical protein [Caldilineaceae bacterium]